MPKDILAPKPKTVNPIYQNTEDGKEEDVQKKENPPEQKSETPEQPGPPPKKVKLPTGGQARRTKKRILRFADMHDTRSISVDKRLTPYFDALMEDGPNKTVVANQWILKMLIDAGYPIDPDILTKPFDPHKLKAK